MIIDENQLSLAHNILSATKVKISNNKNNPPTTIDQNSFCCKLAPISVYGVVKLLPANYKDSNSSNFYAKIIQHENCQEESSDAISIGEPNHQPGKAA